jgi:uncharacterized protein (DUF433 family)
MIATATKSFIQSTPGVLGGRARIRDTRVPAWLLVAYRRGGMTDENILASYPTLCVEDLDAASEYALLHPDEIDGAIAENEHNVD